ncbi:MAG: hypothetical protein AAB665_04195 [Patescibacteria group bacterium]
MKTKLVCACVMILACVACGDINREIKSIDDAGGQTSVTEIDAGNPTQDGGNVTPDAGQPTSDAGTDAGTNPDAGTTDDAGQIADGGNPTDGGTVNDAGTTDDAGTTVDGGTTTDSGNPDDAGTTTDGGTETKHKFTPATGSTCTLWGPGVANPVGSVAGTGTEVGVSDAADSLTCNIAPIACDGDIAKVCKVLPGHESESTPDPGCNFAGVCAVYMTEQADGGTPDSGVTPDAGTLDAGVTEDAGNTVDAGTPDAGTVEDAGTADAGQTIDAGVQPECLKDSDCPPGAEIDCRAPKCELGKCEYPAVREGMSCKSDLKDCTLDVCRGGNCMYEDISCGVGNECVEGKGCQPLPQCTKDADCPPTGEQCTINTCDAGKCAPHPKVNGTACEDGLFCTVNDQCQNGACLPGGARDCGVTNEPFSYMACDESVNACVKLVVDGCYGLEVVDPGPDAVSCTWWSAAGSNLGSFAPHDNISTSSPDGACAVTCYDANGNDVSPQGCSGQWFAGHPQSWSAPGGQLTHGKGCTWDDKQKP